MTVLNRFRPGWGLLPVVVFLGIWELVARFDMLPGDFLLPPFSVISTLSKPQSGSGYIRAMPIFSLWETS